jgi:hypothetical protein
MSVEVIIHTERSAWRRVLPCHGLNARVHCNIAKKIERDCVKALTRLDRIQCNALLTGPCNERQKPECDIMGIDS